MRRLGEYLAARRALVRPEEVGLSSDPSRRVAGLRREEVAALAAISPEYYRRLERGAGAQPSDAVLESLARTLLLTDHARLHMYRLAHKRIELGTPSPVVDLQTRRMLESWKDMVVVVHDRNQDVVASTPIAREALGVYARVGSNILLQVADSASNGPTRLQPLYYWRVAQLAASLRYYGDPDDARYREIVRAMSDDVEFEGIWARQDAEPLSLDPARFWLDGEGWVEFDCEILELPRSPGTVIVSWYPAGRISLAAFERFSRRRARVAWRAASPPPISRDDAEYDRRRA
ncbi:helix-turn-helix domain-containing protein [Microbacterium sp. P05]|uniref:MmyB family transcriptional regulator n=1 Tax=Microbacterium sp. P05 TaxID=3366948 RepID=UPI0037460C3B